MTTETTPLRIQLNDMSAQELNEIIKNKAITLENKTIALAPEIIDELVSLANDSANDFLKVLNAFSTLDKQAFKNSGIKLNLTRELSFAFALKMTTDDVLVLKMRAKLENIKEVQAFVNDPLEKERLNTANGIAKTWGYIPNVIIDTTDTLETLPKYIKGSLVSENSTNYVYLRNQIKGQKSESIRLETKENATPIINEDGDPFFAFSTEYFAVPTPDANLELLEELRVLINQALINEEIINFRELTIEEKNARNALFKEAIEKNPEITFHANTLAQVSSTLLRMLVNESYHKGVNPVLLELMAKNPLVKQFFHLGVDGISYSFANTNRNFDTSLEITKEIFTTAIKHNILTSEAQSALVAISAIEPHYIHAKTAIVAPADPIIERFINTAPTIEAIVVEKAQETQPKEEKAIEAIVVEKAQETQPKEEKAIEAIAVELSQETIETIQPKEEKAIEAIAVELKIPKEEVIPQKPKVKPKIVDDGMLNLFSFDYSYQKNVTNQGSSASSETDEAKVIGGKYSDIFDLEHMTLSEKISTENQRKDALEKEQGMSMAELIEALNNKTIQIPTTKEERIEANLKAINLIKEMNKRKINSFEEYEILKRYTGWGALGDNIISENANVLKTLQSFLTQTELETLQASLTSSYYTPPHVVSSMVKQISEKLFNKEHEFMHILEPSCGNGQVISALYEAFPNARIVGVELDLITSRIAEKMFPDKRVRIINGNFKEVCKSCGDVVFKETQIRKTLKFDLVIGNPPYGTDFKPHPSNFDGGNSSNWEEFFINASANILNDGGIISFVVPNSCMDKAYHSEKNENYKAKSKNYLMLNNVEFKTGVRLPTSTFKTTGTSIGTDIIMLQKKTVFSEKEAFEKFNTSFLAERTYLKNYFEPFMENVLTYMEKENYNTFFELCDLAHKEYAESKGYDLKHLVHNAPYLGLRISDYSFIKETEIPRYLSLHLKNFNHFLVIRNESLIQENDLHFTFAKNRSVKTEFQLELRGNLDQQRLDSMLSDAIEKTKVYGPDSFETPSLKHDLTKEEIFELLGRDEKEKKSSNKITTISKGDQIYDEVFEAVKSYRNGAVFKIDNTYFKLNDFKWEQKKNNPNNKDITLTKIEDDDPILSDRATIDYFDLRDTYLKLVDLETTSAKESNTEQIEAIRDSLNTKYDSFVKRHFYLKSKKAKAYQTIARCPHFLNIANLEKQYIVPNKSKGIKESAIKADIFSRRIIFSHDDNSVKVNSLLDALLLSMKQNAKVDLIGIMDIYNQHITPNLSFEEVISKLKEEELIFKNPNTNNYELSINYLRGHIPARIAEAKAKLEEDPSLAHNIEVLEKMIPPLPNKDEVIPILGCSYVDLETYEEFVVFAYNTLRGGDLKKEEVKLQYTSERNNNKEQTYQTEGTDIVFDKGINPDLFDRFEVNKRKRVNAAGEELPTKTIKGTTVLEYALNPNKSIMIYTTNPETKISELDEVATEAVSSIKNDLQKMFKEWIFSDEERAKKVLTAYRDKYLAIARPNIDKYDSLLALDGLSKNIALRKHQTESSVFSMFSKNTLFNHCVGAGKTYASIVSVISQVKQGLVKKAAIVVPNYLISQWGDEILKIAPNAYCYIADEKSTSFKERENLFINIATNSYEFVVLGHTHLKLLQNNLDFMDKKFKEEMDNYKKALDAQRELGNLSAFRYQQIINAKKFQMDFERNQQEERLKINFDKMGIDFLVIDESHFFKNLPYKTQLKGIKGMGTASGSARAKDLLWKTQYFQTLKNTKVLFLSGTPITNSIVEVYSLMQYLAPDLLKDLNIKGIDDFIKDFAVAKESFEMNLDAKTFKRTERLSEFNNLHALRNILSTFTHTVNLEDLKEQNKGIVPEIEIKEHFINRSSAQAEAYEKLGKRIYKLQNSRSQDDNHLVILHDARSIATDVRLKDLSVEINEDETKNAHIAEKIFSSYQNNNEFKGTQLVYYAINSPKIKSQNIDPTFLGQKKDIEALLEKKNKEELERKIRIVVNRIIEDSVRAGKNQEEIERLIEVAISEIKKDATKDDPNEVLNNVANEAINEIEKDATKDDPNEVLNNVANEAINEIEKDATNDKESKSDDEIYNASLDNNDIVAQRGHTGFCVASNLLRHLVSKGIPQNEIAFVNDFKTGEEKRQMQRMVNKGEIRVLIGSYYNMGVGLNVHERLTDIHLAECPFRPDMITQAIGRIERSGHPLMHSVENFKGQVHLYGVKQTIEANLYGLNAIKSKIVKNLFDTKAELDNSFSDDMEDAGAIFENMQSILSANKNAMNRLIVKKDLKFVENKIINHQVQRNSLLSAISKKEEVSKRLKEMVLEVHDKIEFFEAFRNDLHDYGNEKMLNIFIPKIFPKVSSRFNSDDRKCDVEYNAFSLSENLMNKSSKELTPEENATKANFLIALGKRIRDLAQIYNLQNYLPKELTLMSFKGNFRIVASYNPDAKKGYSFSIAHHIIPNENILAPFHIPQEKQYWIVSHANIGAYENPPQEAEKDPKHLDSFYIKLANKFMDKFEKYLNNTLNNPEELQQDYQKVSLNYEENLKAVEHLKETLEIMEKGMDIKTYEALRDLIKEDDKELKEILSSHEEQDEKPLKYKEYMEAKSIKLV